MISFALATALIAMMFKYLPDAEIEWRDTWLGALITAALFIVGKQVIGLYLGQATVASSFGAAASVVIFMIWVYYAALILLFGAEITQAVAERRGAIVVPTENAKAAPGPPVPGKDLGAPPTGSSSAWSTSVSGGAVASSVMPGSSDCSGSSVASCESSSSGGTKCPMRLVIRSRSASRGAARWMKRTCGAPVRRVSR